MAWIPWIVIGCVTSGCTVPVIPPPDATPTDLDFLQIVPLARVALNLTDHNAGVLSEATFRRRCKGAQEVDLIPVGPITYALLFDFQSHEQVVALAGTTNLDNNAYNVRNELVFDAVAGGRVFSGYRDLALLVLSDLLPRLKPDKPVTIVGFSEGGGVAALLPLWLLADGWTVDLVITLGQPKVTDGGLAGRLALLPLIRLIAADDIVPSYPHLPDYVQFGRAVTLLDGPYIVSLLPGDPGYEDPRDLPDGFPDFLGLDHASYDLRLKSKLGQTVYELPIDSEADISARGARH